MRTEPCQPAIALDRVPLTRTARFVAPGRERTARDPDTANDVVPPGRVPRVARLMALAIRFDSLLREGAVGTQAELAAVGHVTRARVTQIMNLLHLAPDIQEAILNMPPVMSGRDPFGEHELRSLVSMVEWPRQREAWRALTGDRTTPAADR